MPTHGALARWPARTLTQPRPTKSHFFSSFARGPSRARAPRPPGSRARASRWQRARTKSSHERHPSRTAAIRASLCARAPHPPPARTLERARPACGRAREKKSKAPRPARPLRAFSLTPSPRPPRARARPRGTREGERAIARPRRDARRTRLVAHGCCLPGRPGGGGASAARALWRPHGPCRCLPPSGFDRGEAEIACVLTCGSGRRIGRAARARARRPRAPP